MTPRQSKVARALLNKSAAQLAREAGKAVSLRTLLGFEGSDKPDETPKQKPETIAALQKVYRAAGITFDPDGVNVRLAVKAKRKG